MSSANAVPQQPSGGQAVRAKALWHRNKSRAGEPYHSRYLPRGVSAQEVHHHGTSSSPSEGSTLKPAAAPPAPLRAPERRRRRPPEGPAPITPGCAALQLPAPLGANRAGTGTRLGSHSAGRTRRAATAAASRSPAPPFPRHLSPLPPPTAPRRRFPPPPRAAHVTAHRARGGEGGGAEAPPTPIG